MASEPKREREVQILLVGTVVDDVECDIGTRASTDDVPDRRRVDVSIKENYGDGRRRAG
jgi:hypothetical protein